jgi:hypothetical protein
LKQSEDVNPITRKLLYQTAQGFFIFIDLTNQDAIEWAEFWINDIKEKIHDLKHKAIIFILSKTDLTLN